MFGGVKRNIILNIIYYRRRTLVDRYSAHLTIRQKIRVTLTSDPNHYTITKNLKPMNNT